MAAVSSSASSLDTLKQWLESGIVNILWATNPETAEISRWRAFRNTESAQLQSFSNWKSGRTYIPDKLPERMSLAYADFLFSEAPLVATAQDTDQALMRELLKQNRWQSRLRVAADTCVSEREVWWRIYNDPRQILYPILEWTSRTNVVPLIYGSAVLAAAYVTELGKLVGGTSAAAENAPSYRLIEYHENGRLLNQLYEVPKGNDDSKKPGNPVDLGAHPLSAGMQPEWQHSLPMLMGRVRNEEWMKSIYAGVDEMLLELNKTHSIDSENFRLAGKKRAVLDKKYANEQGEMDSAEEILWAEDDFAELDQGPGPFRILEYKYDGSSYVTRVDKLEQIILTRVGLAKQLVDANANEGLAQTGTALRTRLLPTTAAIKGKSQEFSDELPRILSLMAQIDALPEGNGGYGRTWADAVTMPSVTLAEPLPSDADEEANRHATLMGAELESIEEALAQMHPKWSSTKRMFEARRILANRAGWCLDDQGNQVTAEAGPTLADETAAIQGNSPAAAPGSQQAAGTGVTVSAGLNE